MESSSGWLNEHTRRYLPLVCSGSQPYDDSKESKHVLNELFYKAAFDVYLFIPYSKSYE